MRITPGGTPWLSSFDSTPEWDVEIPQLEQLIRRAGSYLEISDDLRPRVLEDARKKQTQRSSAKGAALVLAVLLTVGSGLQMLTSHWQASSTGVVDKSVCLSSVEVFSLAAMKSNDSTEKTTAWNVAEIFAELRSRRAKLLRSAL